MLINQLTYFKKQTKYENVSSEAFTYFYIFGKILNQSFTIEVLKRARLSERTVYLYRPVPAQQRGPGISIVTDGTYRVLVNNDTWLASGDTFFRNDGQLFSTGGGDGKSGLLKVKRSLDVSLIKVDP